VSTPQVLTIPALEVEPGLVHGFSTMSLGTMGLTQAPDPEAVMASRRHFARALDIDAEPLTVAGAVHGANVARIDEHQDVVRGVDALVTDRRGVALFATYADCYPIVLWDAEHRCVALAHAGWRGTVAGVGPAAVKALRDEYGSSPARMKAGIGPGICGRCYEVGEEVASQFDARFVRKGEGERFLLDLAAANRAQLEAEGVGEVHELGLCTKETDYLPSHRRNPDGTRFAAIVALR
jgi:YfiH family protein